MSELNAAIHANYAEIGRGDALRAILAVLDKCQEISGDSKRYTASERWTVEQIEQTIADALGITIHTWCGNCEGIDPQSCINA